MNKKWTMNVEDIREFSLSLDWVEEGFPFGESTLVFKVKGKIFLLLSLESTPVQFNVKCDPEMAVQLREEYPEHVLPGYHMNKKHWNTIITGGPVTDKMLKKFIRNSYILVSGKKN